MKKKLVLASSACLVASAMALGGCSGGSKPAALKSRTIAEKDMKMESCDRSTFRIPALPLPAQCRLTSDQYDTPEYGLRAL